MWPHSHVIADVVGQSLVNGRSTAVNEAAKFVRDFKSLAKEADESLAKHKALEYEIERLLRVVGFVAALAVLITGASQSRQHVSELKLLGLKTGDYDLWSMRMEKYLTHTDYALWEVIVNGDAPAIASASTEAIPDEHLLKFHGIKDAKTLWEAIKTRFEGNKESKKIQKTILKQQYENFTASRSEGRDKSYDRILPLSWNDIALIMRNKSDLYTISMDDLYNNLKVYKAEIKSQSSSRSNSQNVAFVSSENTSNTNEAVNTAYEVAMLTMRVKRFLKKTGRNLNFNGKEIVGFDKTKGYDWSFEAKEGPTDFALMAHLSSGSSSSSCSDSEVRDNSITELKNQLAEALREKDVLKLKLEKFETSSKNLTDLLNSQISVNNKTGIGFNSQMTENELHDIHKNNSKVFKSASDSSVNEIEEENNHVNDRFKKVEGYHVVPPPYTRNYMPSKPDLKVYWLKGILTKSGNVPVNTAKQSSSRAAVSNSTAEKVNTAKGNPQYALQDQGIFDSGCSRHMTGNKSYLTDYQDIDGGLIAFAGSPKEGKITGKGDLTCLFVKATIDESNLWHRRLGHINFKTMNKLVRGNLVRGLPSKLFENDHSCVAYQMGKQHKACLLPELFNKNGVAERKNRTLIEAARTMLADLLLPTTFWAKVVNIACYVQNRVLVTKPHNKTPYELLLGRPPSISFMRPFGCPVTILNTLDPLGKFDGKADEGFLVGYSINSKAFRVFNSRTMKVEENMHINFLENKPNVTGNGPEWLFDIDSLTKSMNYKPVTAGNQTNGDAGGASNKEDDQHVQDFRTELDRLLVQQKEGYANNTNKDSTASLSVSTVGPSINTASENINNGSPNINTTSPIPNDSSMQSLENTCIFDDAYDDREVGAEVDLNNLETTMNVSPIPITRIHKDHPIDQIIRDINSATQTRRMTKISKEHAIVKSKKVIQALTDPSWIEAMQEELLQFKLQKLETRQDWWHKVIPKKNYDEVFAPVARIEAIRFNAQKILDELYGELTFFFGLQVQQKEDGIFISQDKYVTEILKKFDFATVKTTSTPMEPNKAMIKDEEADSVDVHLYISMIGSLMYLTASRPDITFAVCACARDSPFDLEAFSDSDYAGASLDRKSTTGGCQFLGKRLISWQCKKQTIVANSTTEAEYVATANCCGHVLWIQNQILDYGFNFIDTKIYIDNESTICIVKNLVFHFKTKHIEIRHHLIRDSYEKRLIQVLKIYTEYNVVDLLTKGFDVSRFNYLIASIGLLNL
ncbi:uncharacterized mitochondrial protein-like protein [Tanacetum coccineum]